LQRKRQKPLGVHFFVAPCTIDSLAVMGFTIEQSWIQPTPGPVTIEWLGYYSDGWLLTSR